MIDSRLGRDGSEIRRRRECNECRRRFTTRERLDGVLPKVFKRDGRREEFRREKLITAVQKACEKRPVSVPDLLATVFTGLGVDPTMQNLSNVGRPIRLVDPAAKPIEEIVG